MKNILIPTDFSENSMYGVLYGIELAKQLSCSITLVNSYISKQKAGTLKSMDRILKQEAEQEMDGLLSKLKGSLSDLQYNYKIIKGKAVDVITSLADSKHHDMIVMGTKGASELEEVFLGSVAGGVISRTKSPVLVVPEGYKFKTPELIIFGLSGMPLASNEVIKPLIEISKVFRSDVAVLHISKEESDDIENVLEMIQELSPSVMYAFGDTDINTRINNYVRQFNADLLCLIRRKTGYFNRIFRSSVTLKQTFRSKIPLLIFQNNQSENKG